MSSMWMRGALVAGAIGLAGLSRAQSPLSETLTTVEKWVETRQLVSRTRADWQADRDMLEHTVQLYQRELEPLAERRSRISDNSAQVEREMHAAQARQQELDAAFERLEELAGRLEKRILEIAPAFPPPLAKHLEQPLQLIPTTPESAKKIGAPRRMQAVVTILGEVDKFNGAINVVAEVHKTPAGAEVQVETLYVGLGQAYFVDKTGDYAGVGLPTPQGWQWSERKDLAGRIQKSLAMYRNSEPAAFVSLPVQIK